MTARARTAALAAVAVVTVCLMVAALRVTDPGDVLSNTAPLWYLVPGAVVVLRRNGHVIGWLLVANALAWAMQHNTEVVGSALAWAPVAWRAWMNYWIGYTALTGALALLVLFPDGLADRTPRQRRVARAIIATPILATLASMLTTPVGGDSMFPRLYANPTGLGFIPSTIGDYLVLPIVAMGIGAVVGMWRRARHVTGAQRRQYTLVLLAFGLLMIGLMFGLAFSDPTLLGDVAWFPALAGWLLIPTAFAIAIVRHGLYDIDRIISRTVAYGAITAIVAAIYALPVIVLPEVFDLRGALPVAAATLAAAAAFTPVRRVVQRAVDRRFNRARFDAQRELDAFAARLRSQVELDTIVADITTLVGTTLQPSSATTWLRPPRSPTATGGS